MSDAADRGRPYYQDEWLTVYHGDCREAMASVEPESVHCVVTSPPYTPALAGGMSPAAIHQNGPTAMLGDPAGRNIRSVWTIATQPYPGLHFATFPEKLVEPCIKAGTSERGVCPECGAPWVRETGEPIVAEGRGSGNVERKVATNGERMRLNTHLGSSVPWQPTTTPTTGWRPSCAHDAEPIPATVLDPFAGSGTTGMVAQSLSRRAVLIDLSLDYLGQLMKRNADIPLGLGA